MDFCHKGCITLAWELRSGPKGTPKNRDADFWGQSGLVSGTWAPHCSCCSPQNAGGAKPQGRSLVARQQDQNSGHGKPAWFTEVGTPVEPPSSPAAGYSLQLTACKGTSLPPLGPVAAGKGGRKAGVAGVSALSLEACSRIRCFCRCPRMGWCPPWPQWSL